MIKENLEWYMVNGFFAYSLYAGIYLGSSGWYVVAMIIVWLCILATPFMIGEVEVVERIHKRTMSPIIDLGFDLCVIAILLGSGHILGGLGYILHTAVIVIITRD